MKLQRLINNLVVITVTLIICTSVICCKPVTKGKEIRVTMEVSLDEFLRDKANDPNDSALNAAIENTMATRCISDTGFVILFGAIYQRENPGVNMAKLFIKPSQSEIGINSDNETVINALNRQANDAASQTYHILQSRIGMVDKGHPTMEYDPKKGIIKATFKGEYSYDRLNSFMSKGELLFGETYKNEDFLPFWVILNDKLAALDSDNPELWQLFKTRRQKNEPTEKEDTASLKYKEDTGGLNYYVQSANTKCSLDWIRDIDKKAELASKNPLFTVLALSVNSTDQAMALPGPVVGYVFWYDITKLDMILADKRVKDILPAGARIVYGVEDKPKKNKPASKYLPVYAIKYPTDGSLVLDCSCITKARADFDPITGEPAVTIDMNLTGARRWKQFTTKNVGNFIAMVYDNRVFSCPRVDGPIEAASTQVTGSFTIEQANDMANILMSGKLPVPVRIIAAKGYCEIKVYSKS